MDDPKPWTKFAVGLPSSKPNSVEPTCQSLTTVSHVAHVAAAARIVEDARLRADLVFDKSKLNTERIRVVWLSPNDWYHGFRYGNVRFTFDWASLVAGKKAYWVESIAYGVEACRILITDVNRGAQLAPFDPTLGDGPWWAEAAGSHRWNGNFCLEIMLEGDLELDKVKSVDFVNHHQHGCNIDHKTCVYRDVLAADGGADFLARLAFHPSLASLPGLVQKDEKGEHLSIALRQVIGELTDRLGRVKCKSAGTLKAQDRQAPLLARALLRTLVARDSSFDPELIASQFESISQARIALRTEIAGMLGVPPEVVLKLPVWEP